MLDELNKIHIYSVKIICSVVTSISFPNFPGIALRGGFGIALKNSVCIMKQHLYCAPCPLANVCAYALIFENPNTKSSYKMPKSEYIPHPFSLAPLFEYPVTFEPGKTFEFKLSLFGNAVKYFPNVLYAFIELGKMGIGVKRGKFTISRIHNYTTNEVLYDGKSINLNDLKPYLCDNYEYKNNELTITFLTPCKIKSKGKYQRHVDIENLIKNIKRKIEIFSYFFEDNPVSIDIGNIDFGSIQCTESNITWEIIERYSKRKNQRMPLGGYKGNAIVSGNVASIYHLLKIGELINIGSNTSFGFGAIRIT